MLATAAWGLSRAEAQDIEKITKARQGPSASDPGPENSAIRDVSPNTFMPPPTDHGEVASFWNTFSTAHRRIQEGGWSRQVTVAEFPISKDIAGVNMRLDAGGIRELHWHEAVEWGIVLTGSLRLTAIDLQGRAFVNDLNVGDIWVFPSGIPHSIQGLASEGSEFVLVFDDGSFSEGNTTLLTDWLRHAPPEVLAKNWGVDAGALKSIYEVPPDGRYIFQAAVPGPLADDRAAASGSKGPSPIDFSFRMASMAPTFKTKSGEVRIVDSTNLPPATTTAAHVIVKPGGMRELHWHPNAAEWQYYIQGKGRMTVFFTGAKARTADFLAGDVGYVPHTFGHYIENTGDTDLIFLEMFKADRYHDLSLSDWLSHAPPELVMAHLNISKELLQAIPKDKVPVCPA